MDLNSPKMRPGGRKKQQHELAQKLCTYDEIHTQESHEFFQIETTNIYNNYRAIPWIVSLFSGQNLNSTLFMYF